MAIPAAGWLAIGQAGASSMDSVAGAAQTNLGYFRQKKMLRNQQKWAEYMRSSAYQATVQDMRKAGLNPLLAMGQATGSPGAQAPQVAVSNAQGFEKGYQAFWHMKKLRAEAEAANHMVSKIGAEGALAGEAAAKTRVERQLLDTLKPAARAQMKLDKTEFGEKMRWWNRLVGSATGRAR